MDNVFSNVSSTKPCGFKILSNIVLNQSDTGQYKKLTSESQGKHTTANCAEILEISSCPNEDKETHGTPIRSDDRVCNTNGNANTNSVKSEYPKNEVNGINNIGTKSEKYDDPTSKANGNHNTDHDDSLTIYDVPDSEEETETQVQPIQISRKRNNDHLADDEEIVFNYMTGLYEKIKKAKISTDIEIAGEIKEEMAIEESVVTKEETTFKKMVPETKVSPWPSAMFSERRDSFISQKKEIVDTIDLTDDGDEKVEVEDDGDEKVAVEDDGDEKVAVEDDGDEKVTVEHASTDLSDICTDSSSNTGVNLSSKLVCETCSYKAASKQQLIFHLYNNHLKGEYSINFKCKLCAYQTVCEKSIVSHGDFHGNSVPGDISLSKIVNIFVFKRETNVEEVQAVVDSSDSDDPDSIYYKCFDCHFTSTRKDNLKRHCIKHLPTEFTCDKHLTSRKKCLKCIYSDCLLDLQDKVFNCNICDFKTTRRDEFENHKTNFKHVTTKDPSFINESVLALNGTLLRCFHCFYVASSISSLKSHSFEHSAGSFDCDFHHIPDQICSKCVYSHVLKEVKTEKQVKNKEIVCSVDNKAQIRKFKCCHCTYVSGSRTWFKMHAIKHYEEDFSCNLHTNRKVDRCSKCVYQSILEELKREVFLCYNCGFKTLRESTFKKHQNSKENCKKLANEPNIVLDASDDSSDFDVEDAINNEPDEDSDHEDHIRTLKLCCYDCNNFTTDTVEKLEEHSVVHYKTKFCCDQHVAPGASIRCGKCLYSKLKIKATKDLLICEKCSFKTLKKDLFQKHVRLKCKNVENKDKTVSEGAQCLSSEIKATQITRKAYPKPKSVQASRQQSVTVSHKTNEDKFDYVCYDCKNEMFKDVVLFEIHVKTHQLSPFKCTVHDVFDVYCKKCVYQFAINGSKFICKYCTYESSHLEPVLIHMKGNCPYEEEVSLVETTYHKCYDCGFETDSREALWKHSFRHQSRYECLTHQLQKKKTCPMCFYASLVNKGFICKKCDAFLNSEFDLRVHIESIHYKAIPFKCSLHMEYVPSLSCRNCFHAGVFDAASALVNCPVCGQSYTKLENHYKDRHGNSNYSCVEHPFRKRPGRCHSCYAERILAKLQGRQRTYVCLDCNYKCDKIEDLEFHVDIYHAESVFQCTNHTGADIDSLCDMCVYEHITLLGT